MAIPRVISALRGIFGSQAIREADLPAPTEIASHPDEIETLISADRHLKAAGLKSTHISRRVKHLRTQQLKGKTNGQG